MRTEAQHLKRRRELAARRLKDLLEEDTTANTILFKFLDMSPAEAAWEGKPPVGDKGEHLTFTVWEEAHHGR